MALGARVRQMFGRYEPAVSRLYRALFIDFDRWIALVRQWAPAPDHILEVGCGEGAVTERLTLHYPEAEILAIDVTPRLGRLFGGDPSRVTFRQVPVETIAADMPGSFDLVIVSDVIHHVPQELRASLLAASRAAVAPGGTFLFKEWVRSSTPIHWLCEASDRYLTGDDVAYLDDTEARDMIVSAFGADAILDSCRVRPWRNNMAMLLKPAA